MSFLTLMAGCTQSVISFAGVTVDMSLVDGNAFIDNCSVDLSEYVGQMLVISDGANEISGYIKAQGTTRTLGSELVTNGNLEAFSGSPLRSDNWTGVGGDDPGFSRVADPHGGTYAGGQVANTGGHGGDPEDIYVFQSIYSGGSDTGKLYYLDSWAKQPAAGGTGRISFSPSDLASATLLASSSTSSYTELAVYFTAVGAGSDLRLVINTDPSPDPSAFLWDDISCKRVTAPSSSGYTIKSTSGGSTENWTSKDAGFDPNKASYNIFIF